MNYILFFIFLITIGCQNHPDIHVETQDQTTLFSGVAMTMPYRIIVGEALHSTQIDLIKNSIADTFKQVNNIYNKWNPLSELSKLNILQANIKATISPELERLFKKTDLIFTLSNGRFDPTIEPLQALWKKALDKKTIPTSSEIDKIAPAIGWKNIHFNDGIFYKDHSLTQIDLGGIAKGLSVDLLVERLHELKFVNVFVEWGGEIKTSGKHPENRPWTIFISRLGNESPNDAIDIVPLTNQAIATSGDYLQNWSIQMPNNFSKTYFHIFDKETLSPLQSTYTSIASTSVVANDAWFADGLATALMLFSDIKEAEIWAETIQVRYPEVSFWVTSREELKTN